jgi:Beta-galactosidase
MGTLYAILIAAVAAEGLPMANETVIESFGGTDLPPNLVRHNVDVKLVPRGDAQGLQVDFQVVDWPNVFFQGPEGGWDWSEYTGIAVDLHNPTDKTVVVCLRVDNEGANGLTNCNTSKTTVLPKGSATLRGSFRHDDSGPFWGMRGIPFLGPITEGSKVDPSEIAAFQVFLPVPSEPHTLVIDNVRLYGGYGKSIEELVPLPFVDRFGQFKHADWPGKVASEADLEKRQRQEEQALAAMSALPGRDEYGGWADGPELESTGWFRTEQVDGKWWLVTPSGHLFLSFGMDCVGTWEQTFVEKRDDWFEWLPEADSPLAAFYGHQKNAHRGAEPIGGAGRTYSFYRANLMRKYGGDWPVKWRETSYKRLQSWGFNTIANWSQQDVLDHSPMPFVASAGIHGDVRRLDAGGGYWSPMIDVYDPAFAVAAENCLRPVAERYGKNPLCLGYFVDNEMSWEGVRKGVLASPPDQPSRVAAVKALQDKHGSLDALNAAWETNAQDWDSLRVPGKENEGCKGDLDALEYGFACRYFETVKSVLRKYAANHLYLGCRFSSAPPNAVRAAGDVLDVVSFNRYEERIKNDKWTGENDLGKPLIVGEFHFGALDRGMFHTGLVGAADQNDRAAKYAGYIQSVADCPAYVGCHWFQYIDEPITGRWFDGENYNIGFVNGVDLPYAEMVEAAREAHGEAYRRRFGSGKP